jgi:hypothetical protein
VAWAGAHRVGPATVRQRRRSTSASSLMAAAVSSMAGARMRRERGEEALHGKGKMWKKKGVTATGRLLLY